MSTPTVKRSEAMERLRSINKMNDAEIALNAGFVRDAATAAHIHMQHLRKDRDKWKRLYEKAIQDGAKGAQPLNYSGRNT